ncbi:hypothetical protein H6G41_22290 [Tolypothrix sp. FACHB-123]|uniref:hypothetical protein n=1 Tax=Tolypothrix sp. FACHB-123 TaxID=2692868 RepID=UPI001685F2B2|nr:hypothetical protein [Tolypothrix sp. FACHB-123]MBD2357315.1 hypothetical protein [Tolypothrix sp. FACHB-123]
MLIHEDICEPARTTVNSQPSTESLIDPKILAIAKRFQVRLSTQEIPPKRAV